MTGFEIAIYLALVAAATDRKNDAFETGKDRQNWLMDDNSTKRDILSQENTEKQDDLLDKLGKDNVTADTAAESARITDIMNKAGVIKGGDKLVSSSAPQIVKDAMAAAIKSSGTKVQKRGADKAKLTALTGAMGEYNPDFADANALASNIAGKLKGNQGVTEIGMKEAAETYDQGGDVMGQLADLYGMYLMSSSGGGEDPTIIGGSTASSGSTGNASPTWKTHGAA